MTNPRFATLSARLSRRSVVHGAALGAASVAAMPFLAASAQNATPDACADISPDEKLAMAASFFSEGLAEGNLDVVDEIYAPASTHDGAFFPVAPDHQAIKDMLADIRTAFPDLTVVMDDAFTDGEFVVIRWTCSGTFAAPVQGFEPTGEYVSWSGVNIFQFACGVIVESWSEADNLTQLGFGRDSDTEVVATPVIATPVAACTETSEAENIELVQQWLSVFTHGNLDALADLVTPDTRHHFGLRRDTTGLGPLQEGVQLFLTGFPDMETVVEQAIAHDNLVALRYSVTGTFDGPFLGADPNGTRAEWTGINVFRIECGLVAESWSEVAGLSLWQQLGIVPPAATPAS